MPASPVPAKSANDRTVSFRPTFVFIEVFGCEGGIQSYIQDVLDAYRHLPFEAADVFLLRDGPESLPGLAEQAFRFHCFKSAGAMQSRVKLTLALLGHLLWQRPSHVFCGHINLAAMVRQLCGGLRLPYTVLTYGKEVWYPLPPRERRALAQASHIWTISRYSRDLACQANQLNPKKISLLPCVVDGDRFTPGPAQPSLRQRYGLTDTDRVLMTVARLWSGDIYKGVDVTIRALDAIAAIFPSVKYLVIGRGDDQPRLAQLAQELGVADRVIFAGFVPTEDLVNHYRLADGYVMPSKEGFGIVYLEAMACGVPVIAGDDDGSADPLQDGRLGWQVPHRDPEAVAAACIDLLKGEDARCDGKWLRQEALNHFGSEALARQLGRLIEAFKSADRSV
ncbi:MAG: glycosyltransferase family 4 protein [Cyanobacteria bacterium P01_A01_bin.114]